MEKTIIIGSRGSELALWQANFLQTELSDLGYSSEVKIIKTQGDKIQHLSLEKLEGKGFFTKEIEDALLNNTVDVAVHSHKDLPTDFTPGLTIAAVSHREDPSEIILIRKESVDPLKIFQLKENAIIGTSSSRRNVQLKFFRQDLICKDIRGNVPTRIEKLRNGDFDAIVLAFAGVHRLRLNLDDLHVVKINPQKIVPAPAQGVLAFQCRSKDDRMLGILQKLNKAEVAETIAVERKVMNLFQGGCHMPLGVFCEEKNNEYNVWVAQADEKGNLLKRLFFNADSTDQLAEKIFQTIRKTTNKKVFISSSPSITDHHIQILVNSGYIVESISFVEINRIPIKSELKLDEFDWIFFSSKNGVVHFFEQSNNLPPQIKLAAIGSETAKMIQHYGYQVAFTGEGENAIISEAFISLAEGKKILFPGAQNRQPDIQEIISKYCKTTPLMVYDNREYSPKKIDADILVFTSNLNVEGYLIDNTINPHHIVIAIGLNTKKYLIEKGFKNVLTPPQKSLLSIAELISGLQFAD